MARPSRSTRNSSLRAPYPFETEPTATESGTQPGQALYDTPPPDVPNTELDRSQRTRKRTARISTHTEEQAKSHNLSGKIRRTKARNAKKAARVSKKKAGSGSLSDGLEDDEDGDEDYNEGEEEVLSDEEELNESVDGLDGDDTTGQQDSSRDDYQAEPLARQDTDIDADNSERERLLLRLYESTEKDFGAHATPELRKIWRAYCEDQEVSDEVEVQYPSIERLAEYDVAVGGGYQPATSADSQPERTKRTLVEPVATASKRSRLTVDSSAISSVAEPPSLRSTPIPPPSFVTRPTQPAAPLAPSILAPNRGAPLRAQNAPLPPPNPTGIFSHPQIQSLGPRSSGSTAPTVLDDPPRLPTPTPPLRSLPPPPRNVHPTRLRATQPISLSAPTTTAFAPRAPMAAASRAPIIPNSRAPTTRVLAHAIPRESTPAPGTSGHASCWLTFDDEELEPLPEPIPQPQPRPTPRSNAPSTSRAARAPTGITRFNIELGGSKPPQAGAGAMAATDRYSRDLGGPAPGVPPRVRPYVPYTDLVHDRAEEFAAADARVNGRRLLPGRKPKPHARNYNGDERMMIPFTAKHHFGLMVVDNPFGNRLYSRQTAMDAFEQQWARLVPTKELRLPNEEYFNLLVNRTATSRCDVRNRIRSVAQTSAGFIHPPRTIEDFQYNQARVTALLPSRFHYGSLDPPANPYANVDISRALGAALFHSPTAVGVVHRELFGPLMPLQAIAFILTYFHVCISEFTPGRYEAIDLNAAAQYQLYISIARGLEAYEQRAPTRLHHMQEGWYQYALAFAGIDDNEAQAEASYQDIVPLEDIRPDTPEPDAYEAPDLPELAADAAHNDRIGCDEDGWQEYTHEDLYGDDQPTENERGEDEFDYEPEPAPEPEPEFNHDGRLTARTKGKGPSRRARR